MTFGPSALFFIIGRGHGVPASASGRAYRIVVIFIGCHYGPAGVHNSPCNLITQLRPQTADIKNFINTLRLFKGGRWYI